MIEGLLLLSGREEASVFENVDIWWSIRVETLSNEIVQIKKQIEERERQISELNGEMQDTYQRFIAKMNDSCENRLRSILINTANTTISEINNIFTQQIRSQQKIHEQIQNEILDIQRQSDRIEKKSEILSRIKKNLEDEIASTVKKLDETTRNDVVMEIDTKILRMRDEMNQKMASKLDEDIEKLKTKIHRRKDLVKRFTKEKNQCEDRITRLAETIKTITQMCNIAENNCPLRKFEMYTSTDVDIPPIRRKKIQSVGNLMVLAPIRVLGRKTNPSLLFSKY